jgi:protein SCO1/2
MKRKPSTFPLIILIISVGLVSFGLYSLNKMPESPYPGIQGDFALKGADGTLAFKDMLGKVGIIFFGYTHCPDVCPATLVNVGGALRLLNESEQDKVKAVFISLDPERDTPEKATKYAQYFHPRIMGLSGSPEEIEAAARSFLVGYEINKPNAAGNYTISHSTYIFLIRPDGKIGELVSHTSKPEDIAKSIRQWLPWAEG